MKDGMKPKFFVFHHCVAESTVENEVPCGDAKTKWLAMLWMKSNRIVLAI